jgi:hypothetical protein
MRLLVLSLGGLLVLSASVVAQTTCRAASGRIVERGDLYTIMRVTLPSPPASLTAMAVIANSHRRAGAYVFTLSKLLASNPQRSVEMLPAAAQLASEGHSSIVLERVLTWPDIDDSVGQMTAQVLCAEQWLSTHAATRADNWTFVGPTEDVPTFEQLRLVGDTTSMTFQWGLPLAGSGDNRTTESVLQRGMERTVAVMSHSHGPDLPVTH